MATIRPRARADGSTYYQVRYRLDGVETSTSFDRRKDAQELCRLIETLGAARALEVLQIDRPSRAAMTVEKWVADHIDHLTGVQPSTLHAYRAYLRNDIAPTLGAIPLSQLTDRDISRWIRGMTGSAKTIANKQRFLSSALSAAVKAGHLAANPAAGARLPRSQRREMVFLTRDEFAVLLAEVTEPWRPMVEFLVASGARWGEATALKPGDVDRAEHTVRITRAWKYSGSHGYQLGPPKTRRSVRTINVPASVLDKLDYSHEWLFVNRSGGPVRIHGFQPRVWQPALDRAEPRIGKRPRVHDLRHTCASWLIQAGVPLPVVQQHLGHESIETTVGVYGHLDRRSAQAAADAIGKLLDSHEKQER
ncbi:tyrosine-type recombinase/integrase [Mycobacterium botniense]|uniref:Site-specific integrase n=1 Tax=Mycobacterium botniense TaxID=84962 RepID=A0A7I9XRW2_9MYCO|nr:site-specific integrase [Mycobacterium botniense]GFG72731.1 site-specific integrase [Mycobacterium botniense]